MVPQASLDGKRFARASLEQGQLIRAFAAVGSLPCLRISQQRALELLDQDGAEPAAIVTAIEADPALVIAVLRRANAGTACASSVSDAAVRLGPAELRRAVADVPSIARGGERSLLASDAESFRMHALTTQRIADRVRAEAQAKRGRGAAGRVGRVLGATGLVVVGVLLVLLVGSYAWYQGFRKSPPYSLALLVDAAQHDDVQSVETLIDADQIAQGFIPQVINSLTGAGSQLPPQAQATLTATIPALLPRVRETTRDEIARAMKGLSQNQTSNLPFFVKALGVRQAATVVERGDAANVNFNMGNRPVELSMRRDGERWKVVTVTDPQLASEIAARLAASLPTAQPPQQQNQPRRKGR